MPMNYLNMSMSKDEQLTDEHAEIFGNSIVKMT